MDVQALARRVAPALDELGLECLGIEWVPGRGEGLLRLYIDRAGAAVTVDDCEAASREVAARGQTPPARPHRRGRGREDQAGSRWRGIRDAARRGGKRASGAGLGSPGLQPQAEAGKGQAQTLREQKLDSGFRAMCGPGMTKREYPGFLPP